MSFIAKQLETDQTMGRVVAAMQRRDVPALPRASFNMASKVFSVGFPLGESVRYSDSRLIPASAKNTMGFVILGLAGIRVDLHEFNMYTFTYIFQDEIYECHSCRDYHRGHRIARVADAHHHNKPAGYIVSPKMMEAMLDSIAERIAEDRAKSRLSTLGKARKVKLDEL